MTDFPFWQLVAAIALMWFAQLGLSFFQYRRFYKRMTELRKFGKRAATGMAGSNWTLKAYGVLVVDENDLIVKAEQLSGFTVFAGLKPVTQLEGQPLSVVAEKKPMPGIKKRVWQAFQKAKEYLDNPPGKKDRELKTEFEAQAKGGAGPLT